VQQAYTQPTFEASDELRDRGWRESKSLGGGGEAPALDHLNVGPQIGNGGHSQLQFLNLDPKRWIIAYEPKPYDDSALS
jgi:hypothetical protein